MNTVDLFPSLLNLVYNEREFMDSMLKATKVGISKLEHETGVSNDKIFKLRYLSQDRLECVLVTNKSKNFDGFRQ